jgi:DNA-binding NtrC family response regulator
MKGMEDKDRLLVVDDEPDMLNLIQRRISADLACEVDTAASGAEAIKLAKAKNYDLGLFDIRMPEMDGLQLLEQIRQLSPWMTVVMMTAHGVVEPAVLSIKKGAYDFITKPFDYDDLVHVLRKALERCHLLRENLNLQRRVKKSEPFQDLIGTSPAMRRIYETIQMIAKTDVTVLITGESGTGKELATRAIHSLSLRSEKNLVAVNCPALPENILESELFGYKKGAFTDATRDKKGLFEEAQGGTIYLDEIGDIAMPIQTKLLRVLQEKEIKPLGQAQSIPVDVRVIASTNCKLKNKIAEGTFREDLYYRLNVLALDMPALRDRKEDIPLLVDHFLKQYCKEFGKSARSLSPTFLDQLLRRRWEGNVRQLENVVKRAVLLSSGDVIEPHEIGLDQKSDSACISISEIHSMSYKEAKAAALHRFHTEYLSELLRHHQGNVTQAAAACELERQGLQQIMRRYGIKSEGFRQK